MWQARSLSALVFRTLKLLLDASLAFLRPYPVGGLTLKKMTCELVFLEGIDVMYPFLGFPTLMTFFIIK
jgi:hypothetical protein